MARKKLLLRIDQSLWDEIRRWSDDEFRSINAQIEYLLREAVRARRLGKTRQARVGGDIEE